ncbi:TraB/GumN family protein [Gelidibacter sp. F63206]|uniref:TraB/GumN family protein n=1 Tax=Gelidibacter sp. F63206 TaxID=2926425 RepID=UPI001FF173B4|nr:TraB/GumN family protein [Gelidibacter sp. F63206]MCK0114719.1 TraB/GumN family protein [Gelidibacter sp. F63206]
MMNRLVKSIVITVLSFFSVTMIAQENDKTNLWKIEGDEIKTSYLFGTMHLIPEKDFILKDKVKTAFDSSELLVLELDMSHPEFMEDMMAQAYLEPGTELKSFMDDSEYELLDNFLKEKTGIGMQMYNTMKPFMLMSVVLMASVDGPLASFEMTLMQMAKESDKQIKGLETIATQVGVFDATPYERQLDDLLDMIKNLDESTALFNTMAQLYISEDIDALYGYMDDYMNGDLEMMARFLDERNNNWIPEISKFSKEFSTFYGVGAAHLAGVQGVINLLRKAGYTVTPVMD